MCLFSTLELLGNICYAESTKSRCCFSMIQEEHTQAFASLPFWSQILDVQLFVEVSWMKFHGTKCNSMYIDPLGCAKWPNGVMTDFSLQSLVVLFDASWNRYQLFTMVCHARSSPTAHQQINISKYAFYLAAPLNHRRLPGVRMRKVSLLQNPCLLQGFTWNKSASSPIFDQSLSYVYIDYYFFTFLYTKDAFQSYLARKMSLWFTQYNSFFIVLCLYDTAINHESCRYVPLLVLIDSYQSVFF